jgi:hypothetical protein
VATYDSLTTEQKALIGQAERWMRGAMSSLVAYADAADFNLKEAYWLNEVKPILDTLDNGEIIPNSSGLAGAVDITEGQMQAVMTWLFGIQGDIDTNISVVVKLIGINANVNGG